MTEEQYTKVGERNYLKIDLDSKIEFIQRTEEYGTAEFEFCPVFKRGKMTDLFIVRCQQKNNECYHLALENLGFNKTTQFEIGSWTHKTDSPTIWKNFWCKAHKAICFCTYAPKDTDTIEFDYHFGNYLTIKFVGKEQPILCDECGTTKKSKTQDGKSEFIDHKVGCPILTNSACTSTGAYP